MIPFLGQDNNWDSCVITLLLTQHWIYFDFSSQVSFFNVQTNRKTKTRAWESVDRVSDSDSLAFPTPTPDSDSPKNPPTPDSRLPHCDKFSKFPTPDSDSPTFPTPDSRLLTPKNPLTPDSRLRLSSPEKNNKNFCRSMEFKKLSLSLCCFKNCTFYIHLKPK